MGTGGFWGGGRHMFDRSLTQLSKRFTRDVHASQPLTRLRTAAVSLTVMTSLLSSAPVMASSVGPSAGVGVVGVVAVDAAADVVAEEVRHQLQSGVQTPGVNVLTDVTLRERLAPPAGPTVDLATAKATLEAADTAFNAVEHERSVAMLESLIEQLEKDSVFSVEKRELLQTARLQCARRLMGIAGPTETGKAESKNGVRAKGHLEAALRLDGNIVLDAQSAAPKLRALLQSAQESVKAGTHAAMAVESRPAGATVYLDGRPMGKTPLVTGPMVSSGRYRLWLEKDGRRSHTRVVDVTESALGATINIVVEGALRPAGPGLTMPMEPFDVDDIQSLARRLGVDRLVVIGPADGAAGAAGAAVDSSAGAWTLTVFHKDGTVVHGDHSSAEHPLQTADQLVASLTGPESVVPPSAALYRAVAPGAAITATDGDDGAGVPWLAIGVGVGAAVVVGAVTATVLVLTTTDTVSVRIVDVVQR